MKPHTEIDNTDQNDSITAKVPDHYNEVWVSVTESERTAEVMLYPDQAERLGMALIRLAHKARKRK